MRRRAASEKWLRAPGLAPKGAEQRAALGRGQRGVPSKTPTAAPGTAPACGSQGRQWLETYSSTSLLSLENVPSWIHLSLFLRRILEEKEGERVWGYGTALQALWERRLTSRLAVSSQGCQYCMGLTHRVHLDLPCPSQMH